MEEILKTIYEYIGKYGLKIVGALVIFLLGKWLAGVVARLVERGLIKAHVEKTLAQFARHMPILEY